MPSPDKPTISDTLRTLIGQSDTPLKHVAEAAGVNYRALHRWFTGTTRTLDVDVANKVYQSLTGEVFVP